MNRNVNIILFKNEKYNVATHFMFREEKILVSF